MWSGLGSSILLRGCILLLRLASEEVAEGVRGGRFVGHCSLFARLPAQEKVRTWVYTLAVVHWLPNPRPCVHYTRAAC